MGYVIFFLLIFILFYWEYTYSPHENLFSFRRNKILYLSFICMVETGKRV